MGGAAELIASMNAKYDELHAAFEENFWSTKMNLKGASGAALTHTKDAYEAFLSDPESLAAVRGALGAGGLSAEQEKVLKTMERTFLCYMMESKEAQELKAEINKEEVVLESDVRGSMKLGFVDPASGEFTEASSVQLRTTLRTADEEAKRKACYEGLRSIGPTVAEQFVKVVKMRNRLARLLGYVDFYDYKVTQAEGFGKARLFEILDGLEERTRPLMQQARSTIQAEKGASAVEPWNMPYALAGDVAKEQDPYFPFEDAVGAWARSFAAMGIGYRGATMRLDLCDRSGKYSNGFCHWPTCAWIKPDGTFVPSQANFTSLATPSAVGSGHTALVTLMHEGGHAAHFANILQPSPFFSQERAPMSVAYAENQSMFLDSLVGDAAWLGRYARDRDGAVMPWPLVEKAIRSKHPYEVLDLRSMIAVPYFEKALYEMDEAALTPQSVQELADKVEREIQGGLASRPLLSVPHILSDESSCYYHGYVLAEMSVHQTRAHFLKTYGQIVDNPKVGTDLSSVYWAPGNGELFLDLVHKLTGKPLTGDAWVESLQEPLEELVASERKEYDAAVKAGPALSPDADVDLNMRVMLVHGDETVADTKEDGFPGALAKYKEWLSKSFPREN